MQGPQQPKTFYSNYIGANSVKHSGNIPNSQASSFVKKSRNNSYSTINASSNAQGIASQELMKASQTQSNLIATGISHHHHNHPVLSNNTILN